LSSRLHAIATHITEEFIYSHIDVKLAELGVGGVSARDLVHATSDYVELGYGRSTTEELGEYAACSQLGLGLEWSGAVEIFRSSKIKFIC